MKQKNEQAKQKQTPYLGFLIVFIIGFVCGVGFAAFKLDSGGPTSASAPGRHQDQPSGQSNEEHQAMHNLEAKVTSEPENFQAWIQLGHLYFDTKQHEKAITAYENSLKYHDGDANLLTDLGVMYRRSGDPAMALEWFDKAQAMDPTHIPSRLNEGIVRLYDFDDAPGAIASWEELLTIDPEAKLGNGETVKDFVAKMKADLAKE